MQNEQLILNRLLEIQEDLGSMKSKNEALEGWMTSLDAKIAAIEKTCGNAVSLQLSSKQIIIIGGTIISIIAGWLGLGGAQ